jgi:hypothetical protein
MLPSGSQNVKALGHPGRCGLLRERSRLARLRPVDAIRRGASSDAHALWSPEVDSRDPPSCGVPNESDFGHGLGNPLRCQRESVKFMRQRAVRVAGPDRIIFSRSLLTCLANQPQRTTEFHRGSATEDDKSALHSSVALLCVPQCSLCNAFELSRSC